LPPVRMAAAAPSSMVMVPAGRTVRPIHRRRLSSLRSAGTSFGDALQMTARCLLALGREQAAAKVEQLMRRQRELEKQLAQAKQQLLTGGAGGAEERIVEVDGIKVLATRMDGADAKTLRDAVDRFKDKLQSAVVVLGSVENGKVRLAAGVTKNNTGRIRAGDVIQPVAEKIGGRGPLSVALIRIVPIAPFNVINFVAGFSRLRLSTFMLGSVLGMAPGMLAVVLVTHQVQSLVARPNWQTWAGLGAILCLVGGAVIWVRRNFNRGKGPLRD